MEFYILIVFDSLQLVEVGHPVLHVRVQVGVHSPDEPVPLAGDEGADTGVLTCLLNATTDEEAGVVDLGGRLPAQEHLAIAGRGGETDQGDDGVGGDDCREEKQEEQALNAPCGAQEACTDPVHVKSLPYILHPALDIGLSPGRFCQAGSAPP